MSLIGLFVRYIFTYFILPIFVIFLIGKPLFLIKILNKFLHFKINNIQIFHFLLLIFGLFDFYFYFSYNSGQKAVQRIIKNEIINTEEYSVRLSQVHSDERNIYIFLTTIAMLLTIHKFGERIIRIDEKEKEKKELEKKLGITETTIGKEKTN
jgi:hypothetical protein